MVLVGRAVAARIVVGIALSVESLVEWPVCQQAFLLSCQCMVVVLAHLICRQHPSGEEAHFVDMSHISLVGVIAGGGCEIQCGFITSEALVCGACCRGGVHLSVPVDGVEDEIARPLVCHGDVCEHVGMQAQAVHCRPIEHQGKCTVG